MGQGSWYFYLFVFVFRKVTPMLSRPHLWTLLLLIGGFLTLIATVSGKDCRIDEDLLQQLVSVDPQQHQAAVEQIVRQPDPQLLTSFREILTRKDSSVRRRVTMLVVQAYPEDAFSFFQNCMEPFDLHRQEAAAHGIGYLMDPRVAEVLEKLLSSKHREIRIAALRGLQLQCRNIVMASFQRVIGASQEQSSMVAIDGYQRAMKVLLRSCLKSPADPDLMQAWGKWANSSITSSSRKRWISSLEPESPLATSAAILFESNENWLGRVAPSAGLDYQFSMVNLVSDSTKEIIIHASSSDIENLRSLSYDLDRVIHLRTASDLLFINPSSLSPRWLAGSDPEIASLVFNISGQSFLHAGIGLLNISYWEGRVQNAHQATVRFAGDSGRFLDETVTDEAGQQLWKLKVQSWFEGGHFPESISIYMTGAQVGTRKTHLRLELKFQQVNGQWLLAEGKTFERTESGEEELRAYCEVEPLSLPTPSPVPGEEEPSDDASGQGSTAGSPRE